MNDQVKPRGGVKLGCIADDFTGGTDLANNLVRSGFRVVQTIGVPPGEVHGVDAVVVALKSRTIDPNEAVAQSLEALDWLRRIGCRQFYFKVCSTFDSTPRGNIGPVAEALLEALDETFCCVTPAFPETGRAVFKGHLFVGDVLLSESGMRDHPLTPMNDPNLVRVLQQQVTGRVSLIEHAAVSGGAAAIRERIKVLRRGGTQFAIVDAVDDDDLLALGQALAGERLVVAGSGVAIGLGVNFDIEPSEQAAALPRPAGRQAIVSGSCSAATNRQVAEFIASGGAALAIDPLRLGAREDVVSEALDWAAGRLDLGPVLVYSTAAPQSVRQAQGALGASVAGSEIERALAAIAKGLVCNGVRQLIVAGGETSGACVQALGVRQLRIGPQIDPGVPWCHAQAPACDTTLHLALKSGNFGSPDFFSKAFGRLA